MCASGVPEVVTHVLSKRAVHTPGVEVHLLLISQVTPTTLQCIQCILGSEVDQKSLARHHPSPPSNVVDQAPKNVPVQQLPSPGLAVAQHVIYPWTPYLRLTMMSLRAISMALTQMYPTHLNMVLITS